MKQIILSVIFFAIAIAFNPKQNKDLIRHNLPSAHLSYTHFGFKEVIADGLWITFIQNAWACAPNYMKKEKEICPQGWGFAMLDTATELAPKFHSVYKWGATQLSVMMDDHEGAKVLFNRGLEHYPDDWLVNYRAGYLFMVELDEKERAAELLNKAGKLGAPEWAQSLSAKLYQKSGKLEISYRILSEMIDAHSDSDWRNELIERRNKIEHQLRDPASE